MPEMLMDFHGYIPHRDVRILQPNDFFMFAFVFRVVTGRFMSCSRRLSPMASALL